MKSLSLNKSEDKQTTYKYWIRIYSPSSYQQIFRYTDFQNLTPVATTKLHSRNCIPRKYEIYSKSYNEDYSWLAKIGFGCC